MGTFLLRCPTTGLPINPGIETDEETLAVIADRIIDVECPHCGKRHFSRMRDGKLNESARVKSVRREMS